MYHDLPMRPYFVRGDIHPIGIYRGMIWTAIRANPTGRPKERNRPVRGARMKEIGYCDHGHKPADCVRQFEIDTGFIRPVCPVCGRRYAVIEIDWQYRKQAEIN